MINRFLFSKRILIKMIWIDEIFRLFECKFDIYFLDID